VEVVTSLSQGRTAAAQCGLFTHKSVPVIFEPPCRSPDSSITTLLYGCLQFSFPLISPDILLKTFLLNPPSRSVSISLGIQDSPRYVAVGTRAF